MSILHLGVNLIDEVVSWSHLEDNAIVSFLENDILLEYESNKELHELYKNFSSDEMLDELNAICCKHETQLEDSSFKPKSVVKTSVGEPPPLDFNPSFSTLDQSLVVNNETHHVVISSVIVHNQKFQVLNLLKQHKEASTWSMNDVSGMRFILVQDHLTLVDIVFSVGEFHMLVDCVMKVVFPRAGIG